MNYPNAGYVYAIRNTLNGGMYIGSTTSYKSRWATHRSTLRRGKHHSFVLQKAWDKYGESAFAFELLVVCAKNLRIEYENRLMPLQRYNVLRTAKESMVRGGWEHTEAFKVKMSQRLSGVPLSEPHKQKIRLSRLGVPRDQNFKDKARNRQLGILPAAPTKAKLSAAMKQHRAEEVKRNEDSARSAHAAYLLGASMATACRENNLSISTFYKYVKLLGLSLRGHVRHARAI